MYGLRLYHENGTDPGNGQLWRLGSSGGSSRLSRHSNTHTDHNGSISEEIQPGESAPKTKISTPLDTLADIVLNPAKKDEVNDGTDITIILKIEDGTYLVPASDKTKVETVIGGMQDYKLGQYLAESARGFDIFRDLGHLY